MLRFIAGAVSALLLTVGGFFVWKGQAGTEDPLPPPPPPRMLSAPAPMLQPDRSPRGLPPPPQATEKSKEEKRFARADKDKDGRITLEELYQPRRKAFAKLDGNGDGRLSFEEWAASTGEKLRKADADRSGWLSPREYEATKPKTKAKPKCRC
ncbi:MAG TPA: EF-hand domain-containing protein [Allosphingosinicella sp.]|nr:EF-hand domain-containing protein [Allosphingosinicella sp.]